ncbi:hypothetical protein [Kineococcus sp. SYSU DK006]|uniref:hypothetical protein n=1 Tax=Kineococcus sp. SYSU DK006 TaxID=3383127 RepID=UPI003D7DE2FB
MTATRVSAGAAVEGLVTGLVLMAVFTVAWAANTLSTWPGAIGWAITAAGGLAAAWFTATAVRLVRARGSFAGPPPEQDRQYRRRSGRAFGLVFALEVVAIVVAADLLNATGHQDLVLPVIALIVGLHFYPMARIFRRRIDVWLASWLCGVAVAGIVAVLATDLPVAPVWGAVAVGAAATTASYGLYMSRLAARLLRRARPGADTAP